MKRNLVIALIAIAACSFAWAQSTDRNVRSAGSPEDEAAIRGIVQARMAGNNLLEEFQSYANVAPDLDWENAFGGHVSGRDEVHKFMAERVRSSVTEASEPAPVSAIKPLTPPALDSSGVRKRGKTPGI